MLDDARARDLARHQMPSLWEYLVETIAVDQNERRHVDRREHGTNVRVQVAGQLRRETTGRDRGPGVANEPLPLRPVGGVPPIHRAPSVADGLNLLLPAR